MKVVIEVKSGFKWDLEAEISDSCSVLKQKLVDSSIIPYDMIGLVYGNVPFEENMTLEDLKYVEGTTIILLILISKVVKPLKKDSYRILKKNDDGTVEYELNRSFFNDDELKNFGMYSCINSNNNSNNNNSNNNNSNNNNSSTQEMLQITNEESNEESNEELIEELIDESNIINEELIDD